MKKKKENPGYYSIMPASVRYDNSLNGNEKLMYGEITALANKNGRAWASNNYFAELYGVHKRTVSRWISNLVKQGYIRVKLEYIPGTKQVSKRYLYINDSPMDNNVNRYAQKDEYPMHENVKEELNNTSVNNTSVNKESVKNPKSKISDAHLRLASELWEYVSKNFPKHKEPNLESWANDIRLMIERDNRTEAEISDAIKWSQSDSFWYQNIRSTSKLRKQFDTLVAQADGEGIKFGSGNNYDNDWDFFSS